MAIEVKRDKNQSLTIHTVKGLASEEEMYEALENFYNQEPTSLLLWDMSQAEVAHVKMDTLKAFIKRATALGNKRKDGKTAIFAPHDLQFGLARMSEVFAELESSPFKMGVFRSRQSALDWLTADDTQTGQ